MKKRILLLVLALASVVIANAQSMLCTYKGGYFIRNDNTWYEYRPQDKDAVWNTYTQYSSDNNYYYIKNSSCSLSIPKSTANNIWMKKGNGEWKVQYTTVNVYNYCPVRSTKIFAYQNGFFTKNGNNWQEYDPKQKTNGALDNFTQYKVDDNFYYIRNARITLAIPRSASNNFHFLKNGSWVTLYHPSALYDAQSPNAQSGNNHVASNNSSSSGNGQSFQSNNSSQSKNSSGTSQKWREELGYGMFAINIGNPNGAWTRTIYRACVACRGTVQCGNCHGLKMCTICKGKGGIITAGYGNYIPCMACFQTGRCGVCHGTGKCVCANSEYPGYMPGSTLVLGANGQVFHNSRDYDNGSSSSSSSSSSSRSSSSSGVCSKCHGTGVDPSQSSGGNLTSWVAHYNASGQKCPYCDRYNEHWHIRCPHCNVPSR